MKNTEREITAIPTVYNGVQLKSRMEAQCAVLFDKLGWKWEYEPQSYMLPHGVAYTPDFYLPEVRTFVECRGYSGKRSDSQISEFGDLVIGEAADFPDGREVIRFVSIKEGDARVYRLAAHGFNDGCLIAYCSYCKAYRFMAIGEEGCHFCGCHSCTIERVWVLAARAGKILLNRFQSDQWEAMLA